MQFLGKVVILEKPAIDDRPSGIELGPEARKQLEEGLVKKFSRLKVFGTGATVADVKVGDEVLVTPKSLSYADTFELENKIYYVVPESQVIAVYK